ncbi:MAG: Smr/MutS family protein [Acidobacteria bacterium]|nr:Smr/MutS family protein [Acidobacteriota bacterium]
MSFSLNILEFEKLLELVSRHAQTPMGGALVKELRPKTNNSDLERELSAISETILLNEEKQVVWSFSGLQDPADAIAILRIRNTSLEPNLLLEVSRVANQAIFARSAIQPEKEFVPVLWSLVETIPPSLLATLEKIGRKILPGGEIDDTASPELARLRREINAQRSRLTRSLESVMRNSGDAIQDELVTMRNDRFVIPVKSDFRGKVGGVAHGFSSSGQTVFIEPLEAIEANNELQNLKGKEEREIARILFDLTEELREQLPAIEAAVDAVGKLDLIKAKVEFARKFNAVVPEISDDGTLELIDARHPLLEENLRTAKTEEVGEKESVGVEGKNPRSAIRDPQSDGPRSEVVPSSLTLTADRSVMIISGANAGGKTVVLKTAGLLSLMAISGLPVPAKEARVPFYRSILADIGDHQSLSANLSTFSSHMSNIADMMRECVPPSLVLLDEAGTGTDPEEGSALGVAIVDHFRQKQAQVIASTHYRGLKMYAANDPNVINASVEFDERTLQPTYKLLIGLAGASSGIEIAGRFGILPEVIDAARQNLDISAQQAEEYLAKLQTETRRAEDLRIALEEEREATAMKYAGLEVEAAKKEKARQKEFERKLAETLDSFERQSKAFIQSIEDKALRNKLEKERSARKAELNRAILAKLNDTETRRHAGTTKSEPGAIATGFLGGQRSDTDPVSRTHGASASDDSAFRDPHSAIPTVGSRVITTFGTTGTIEKLDKDTAEVLVGNMRLRQKLSDLRPAADRADRHRQTETRGSVSSKPSSATLQKPVDPADASAELNLIGRTTAEAEYELDRFIDEAYMASLPRIRIIHGYGTGALKNFVHHTLKNHELIKSYTFASSNEGGNGATIAELKL